MNKSTTPYISVAADIVDLARAHNQLESSHMYCYLDAQPHCIVLNYAGHPLKVYMGALAYRPKNKRTIKTVNLECPFAPTPESLMNYLLTELDRIREQYPYMTTLLVPPCPDFKRAILEAEGYTVVLLD